jgi:hypothetical protein
MTTIPLNPAVRKAVVSNEIKLAKYEHNLNALEAKVQCSKRSVLSCGSSTDHLNPCAAPWGVCGLKNTFLDKLVTSIDTLLDKNPNFNFVDDTSHDAEFLRTIDTISILEDLRTKNLFGFANSVIGMIKRAMDKPSHLRVDLVALLYFLAKTRNQLGNVSDKFVSDVETIIHAPNLTLYSKWSGLQEYINAIPKDAHVPWKFDSKKVLAAVAVTLFTAALVRNNIAASNAAAAAAKAAEQAAEQARAQQAASSSNSSSLLKYAVPAVFGAGGGMAYLNKKRKREGLPTKEWSDYFKKQSSELLPSFLSKEERDKALQARIDKLGQPKESI